MAVTVGATALLVADALPWLRGEGSGVWTWAVERKPFDARLLPALALAAALLALAGSRLPQAAARAGRGARALLLAATVLLGWGLGLALLAPEPGGVARTLLARTLDPLFTSYQTVALRDMPAGAAEFLRHHADLLPDLPMHAATHPPGPALLFRALLVACEASPRTTRAVNTLAGLAAVDPAAFAGLRPAQTPASVAGALLGAALFALAGAAAAVPVARLVTRLTGDPAAGLRAAIVWTLVPGPLLMIPEVDQALALPVAATAAALAGAALAADRAEALRLGVAAGVAAAVALFLSYGALVFLAGAAAGAAALAAGSRASRYRLAAALGAGAAVALALFSATALWGHQPFTAALRALALHGDRHTWWRPWGVAVGLDLADTLLFLGPPLVLLLGLRLAAAQRAAKAGGGLAALAPAGRYAAALVAAFAVALLSGTVRGEAGRLFIPWMPMLAAVCAPPPGDPPAPRPALVALALAAWSFALRLTLRLP